MTLIDSNKLSTKVLHKLKVKLSLWLTNPSQLTRRTTREDSRGTQLTTTQDSRRTMSNTAQLRKTSPQLTVTRRRSTPQIGISNHKLLMYKPTYGLPNKSTDQQYMHNYNWSPMHNSNWSMNSYSQTHQCINSIYSHIQITKQLIQIS